jgi:hypothetical protein
MYQSLTFELTSHLVDQGFTWSTEDNKPPTLRDGIKADLLVSNLLDYMIGAGYASPTKTI